MVDANREPDWTLWSKVAVVELWQAVALSLNIEPRKVHRVQRGSMRIAGKRVKEGQEFSGRLFIAVRNLSKNGPLVPPGGAPVPDSSYRENVSVELAQFSEWASSTGWDIPSEMRAAFIPNAPTPIERQSKPASSSATGEAAAIISARARHAANESHKIDREKKETAITLYREHKKDYRNKDKAAEDIAKKVNRAQSTVRVWLRNI